MVNTQRYATLHYTNYTTQQLQLNCNCNYTNCTTPQLQMQLQLHYTNYTTLQLQLRYTTLHPAVVGEVAIATIAATSKKHSNHLSVHQWICSAIRDSQQPTSPVGFLFVKLPLPLCAVLLVKIENYIYFEYMFLFALYVSTMFSMCF